MRPEYTKLSMGTGFVPRSGGLGPMHGFDENNTVPLCTISSVEFEIKS